MGRDVRAKIGVLPKFARVPAKAFAGEKARRRVVVEGAVASAATNGESAHTSPTRLLLCFTGAAHRARRVPAAMRKPLPLREQSPSKCVTRDGLAWPRARSLCATLAQLRPLADK